MNIKYQLSASDFLAYQLYASSKSKLHQKRRFRSRLIIPIFYVILGLFLALANDRPVVGGIFTGLGVIWFIFYPMYSQWRYKRHFQKHVNENYKNRIHQPVEFELNENSVYVKDMVSESTINGNELKSLIETPGHFFIKLSSGLSLIVPKHTVENQAAFKSLILAFGAEYVNELNWVWK